MKLNTILCPTDYSVYSQSANYYASLFAQSFGARIIYLHVADPPANPRKAEDKLDDLYLELTTQVRPFFHNLRHHYSVGIGKPAAEIVDFAHQQNVELIVMGTHGRTGADHLLHGSVCETVLRKASCPVMAVKNARAVDWILPDPDPQPDGDSTLPTRFGFA